MSMPSLSFPPPSSRSGLAIAGHAIQWCDPDELRAETLRRCRAGGRLAALFSPDGRELWAVVAEDEHNEIVLLRAALEGAAYDALTRELPAAQAFERAIHERHGIVPEGHPWLKPVRRHANLEDRPEEGHVFFRVEGDGVHEVAVGPVHAGIIEPGHFRFQCAGETVLHLEIQLGYQHRGADELMRRAAPARRLVVAESIAGDTAVGHVTAHCAALEAVAGIDPPLRGQMLRGIALELERLANHVGDLGALCNDVGYLPGAAWLGRLRGDFLNLLADLSGNRFGRGLVHPGGVRFDLDAKQRRAWAAALVAAERDLFAVADLALGTASVASRFEQAGVLRREDAEALGLVGPCARASGCDRDVRRDHPTGIYRFAHVPVALSKSGDVMARALVRLVESRRSLTFVREQVEELPPGPISIPFSALRADSAVVSLVEGWRGEICHVAATDDEGELAVYEIGDPSFRNWLGLALAMRGQPISDFPLCNKSFNLSYAGHDL